MDFIEMNDKLNLKEIKETKPKEENEIINELSDQLDISRFISMANFAKIENKEDAKQALSMSLQSRKLKQSLEKTRKKIIKPHIDFQKAVSTIVKDYSEKLTQIEENLSIKLNDWFQSQSTDKDYSDLVMEVEDGKLSTKKDFQFEIEDMELVPKKYLKLDDKKVKEAIKMGVRNIPGMKIIEETKLKMRVKNE